MTENRFLNVLYIILFIMYILGGSTAILLSYIYNFNKEGIGTAILLGAIVSYLLLRKKEIKKEKFILKRNYFKILAIVFFILIIPSIIISNNSHANYYLPLEFFVIISVMASLILIQILFSDNLSKFKQYYILVEIFVLSTLLSSSLIYLFPGPYGNDALTHVGFIHNILNTGTIGNYFTHYVNYPIFHLLFSILVYMTGTNNFKVIQSFLALIIVLSLIFIFILIKKYSNEKIALLSVLLISTIPYILQPQYMYYPMAFSIVFFILTFYLFLNINQSMKMTFLFILSFITLNISHPLTPLFFILISILIVLSSQLYLKKKYLSVTGIILLAVLMLTWWMKPVPFSNDLFSYFLLTIKGAFETADYSDVGSVTLSPLISLYSMILYDLGWVILSFLGIIGAFYCIKKMIVNKKLKNESLYLFVIPLILIPLPYVLAIVYPQSMPDRWFPFIGLFVGIAASFGVFTISKFVGKRKWANIILILVVTTGIFFNITSPIVNPNSHIYSQELSGNSALKSSELDSINFLNTYSNIQNVKGNLKYLGLVYQNMSQNYIDPSDSNTYSNGTLVIRNYDLENGFTLPYGSNNTLKENMKSDSNFIEFLDKTDEIYNNGNLKIYN